MLKSVIRHGFRLGPLMINRVPSAFGSRLVASSVNSQERMWSPVFIGVRTLTTDQQNGGANQMKTPTNLKPKDVESRVLRICSEYDKIQESNKKNLTLATHFMNDLGLDSLDHVEIIVALENEFGFEIPDADYDKLYTIQAVVDYLMKKMNINPTA